ncbi:precorrin-2 C(20)-methyltransferase [Fischerella major NIES-592]|uniref:Precorrin-2 C(20)-methyltransferase n=1 Tax=Fischerella major NIES-592 TaxID=210994 RepID=A0A1U7H2K3_9CYAN|nr:MULTISPECIES: precorrin-2 C(20)-methyltransferase [Fischerella]OKH15346.1 precorrin-2 C(20)-methyltransferase [Fischerella major NIES-592]BAU04218.1 cobalamin biosynthesis precorrin-2 methyltransferase [Fischerella sp. NIES-3754]
MKGRLYGVGVGPGDPELLTLKALRLLRTCPVVAYQSAEDKESVARGIVAEYLPGNQIEVKYHLPRALDPYAAQPIYDQVVTPIAEHLAAGRDVVVLCEGDPLFYGSFMYVFTRLSDQFETEVVPGVSSPMGCASALSVPLSYRDDVFSVLPATLPAETLKAQLLNADAAAIIKLRRHFAKVRDVLHHLGLASRARYIERGTMVNQKIISLDEVYPDQVPYFSMILVPSQSRL